MNKAYQSGENRSIYLPAYEPFEAHIYLGDAIPQKRRKNPRKGRKTTVCGVFANSGVRLQRKATYMWGISAKRWGRIAKVGCKRKDRPQNAKAVGSKRK